MKTAASNAALRPRRDSVPGIEIDRLLAPLDKLARDSDRLFRADMMFNRADGRAGSLPRYLFTGEGDARSFLRVGIFAGVHGDELPGTLGAIELVRRLHENPEPARGYELFVYPVCNPWGVEHSTRWLRSGADMNREFWRGSDEIEVLVLEGQLMKLAFDGVVALHCDDTSDGLYGFARGNELTRHVLEPSLDAAARFLPRNQRSTIDRFEASNGVIETCYTGVLGAPPTQSPRPFEIVFETPQHAGHDLQIEAHTAAVFTMLERFRVMIAEAQNI